MSTDPQAIANDFVYKMKYDNGQEATLVRTCLRSERMGTPEFNRGPMLGEHTVSILKEAGYSDEEIEKYLSEGSSVSMTDLLQQNSQRSLSHWEFHKLKILILLII